MAQPVNVPLTPETNTDAFHKVQEEISESIWQGRGPNYELPGGGNELKTSGDKD